MKKQLKKLVLGTLSAGLVLSLAPTAIFASEEAETSESTEEVASEEVSEEADSEEATESTEETSEDAESTDEAEEEEDLAPSAENPYTEAEITELIKPTEEWDPNLVLEREDFEAGYQEVLDSAKERLTNGEVNLTFDEVVDIMGDDPTSVSETDNGQIFRYVSIQDDIVQVVQYQTYLNSEENGEELTNIEYQYKTAKMFERLETTIEDLQTLYNEGDAAAFTELFGQPQVVTTSLFPDRFTESLMWSVVGNEDVEEGEIAAVEVQTENDELTNLAYYEQEAEDAAATDSESDATEEDSAEETTEEETTEEDSAE